MSLFKEPGRNRDVGTEKILFVLLSSNETSGFTFLKSSFLLSKTVMFTHLVKDSGAVGSHPLYASFCSRVTGGVCQRDGARSFQPFGVSYLCTVNHPSGLPNLDLGIKLPFMTTSHLSRQFRQLTACWSILLSGLCCKMGTVLLYNRLGRKTSKRHTSTKGKTMS